MVLFVLEWSTSINTYLLDVLKVPSTYRGMRIVYKYDDGFHDDFKTAVKREQSDACISYAEREQFRTEFNVSEELQIEYYD